MHLLTLISTGLWGKQTELKDWGLHNAEQPDDMLLNTQLLKQRTAVNADKPQHRAVNIGTPQHSAVHTDKPQRRAVNIGKPQHSGHKCNGLRQKWAKTSPSLN